MTSTHPMTWLELRVRDAVHVSPHMRRIVFTSDNVSTFRSLAPDQQVKLFFARDGGVPRIPEPPADQSGVMGWYQRYLAMPEPERPWMRTYSIRRHRPERDELEIDFVLHDDGESGPASRWAQRARPGDVIGLYGPSVSHIRTPSEHGAKLFVGDETALPAIAAWLESLGPGQQAQVYAEVASPAEEQQWTTTADVQLRWLHRDGTPAGRSTQLLDAVRDARLPEDLGFAWVAGEASMVRAVRRHLVGERGMDKRAVAFTGYWRLHLTQDDDATTEEKAEQSELMAELSEA